MRKVLLAYYSRTGQNYVNGDVVNLEKGNTEVVVDKIHALLPDAEIYKIDTAKPYPDDYRATTEIAHHELRKNLRPELKSPLDSIDRFDTIILGYPNWWGTMPMVVHTFLETYDFFGKLIIPFCTHEGGAMGHSVNDIRRLCPGATVLSGVAILGSTASTADPQAHKLASKATQ